MERGRRFISDERRGMLRRAADGRLRSAGEERDIADIWAEQERLRLKQAIEEELGQPGPVPLTLFDDPERDQYERNKLALQSRLKEIPGEIERETEAVKARFADPQPRMFPVAVTFLVPDRLSK